MHLKSALLLSLGLLLFSCTADKTSSKSESTNTSSEEVQKKGKTLPPIPTERLKRLWEEATNLDYIFLNLPISMNMDNQEAIHSSISHFAPGGVTLNPECKQHDGNMLFIIDGEIVEECQFYYQDGCKYFVWLENGKKTYANPMNQVGIDFMERMFTGAILNDAREPVNQQ